MTRVDACVSCGAELAGPYCARCGQRNDGRLTLRRLGRDVAGKAFGIDQGFLHTVVRLTLSPGSVTRDYLRGRTRPYTHPLAYLVISFAAFALIGELVRTGPSLMSDGNAVFTGLVVVFIAALSRLFDRRRLNYAEHLVVAMYLIGHMALLLAVPQLATPLVSGLVLQVIGAWTATAALLYYIWGYTTTVRRGTLAGVALALVTLIGGFALWGVAVFLVVRSLAS